MKLKEIIELAGGRLAGQVDVEMDITGLAALESAGAQEISFLANPLYTRQVADSRAAAVIVGQGHEWPRPVIVCENPYDAFRKTMIALYGWRKHPFEGVSERCEIDPTAEVAADAVIGPFATVCAGARIGAGSVLYPGVFVGPKTRIGRDCVLYPNVAIYEGCALGDRVTVHANTVIGEDGFGYVTRDGAHHKIPQAGSAEIGDDVEIGACCAIDRAAVGRTTVGEGSKFSNLVAIGHGSHIGPGNLFVAQAGVAGSTATGGFCAFGGQSGVAGHARLGDYVRVGAQSGVSGDVPDGQTVLGSPAAPIAETRRMLIAQKGLPDMKKTLKQMQARLATMEKCLADLGRKVDKDNESEYRVVEP